MTKLTLAAAVALMTLSACAVRPAAQIGPDGQPIPLAYRITPRDAAEKKAVRRRQQGAAGRRQQPRELGGAPRARGREASAVQGGELLGAHRRITGGASRGGAASAGRR